MGKVSRNYCYFVVFLMVFFVLVTGSFIVRAEGVVSGFEDGEPGYWKPRGDAVIQVSGDEAYSGNYSLFTTGRTSDWNGPCIDLQDMVTEEQKYQISVWAKLPEGSSGSLIITIEKNDGSETSWDRVVGPVTASSDEWVQLEGEYTIRSGYEVFTLYVESPDASLDYYIDDIIIAPPGKAAEMAADLSGQEIKTAEEQLAEIELEFEEQSWEEVASIAEVYQDDFLTGTAVQPAQLTGEYAELLVKHFNSITAEDAMSPASVHPEEGQFNFSAADKIVKFDEENGLQVRGHALVLPEQTPNWFFEEVSRTKLLRRLKRHIEAVVGRYKGQVYAWDVVNGVIDPANRENNGLRENKWYQLLGEDYIEKAFEYAHRADPDARLFISDYGLNDSRKRDYMYNLVKRLREKGVPVDGIGMQLHIDIYKPDSRDIETAIRKFSFLGVDLEITELDMSVYKDSSDSYNTVPLQVLLRQGHRYQELFDIFKNYSDMIGNVSLWGMADDLSALSRQRNDWPLLFDESLNAKFAYMGIMDPEGLPPLVEIEEAAVPEAEEAEETEEVVEEVAADPETGSKTVEAVKGTPEIDAEYDDIWDNASVISTNIQVEGDSGATAKIRTMWDEDHLYIYAEVTDPVLSKSNPNSWEQDSIEIFIDENNNKTGSYEDEDSQYRVNFENEQSFDPNPLRDGFVTATRITDTGYVVEAAIEFMTIKAAPGKSIGFDFQVNDDSGSGFRTSVVTWNDSSGDSWQNTSGFGNLIFIE